MKRERHPGSADAVVKRVLVTGGTGKTGTLVAQQLSHYGIEPKVATRNPTRRGEVRFEWTEVATFASVLEDVEGVYLVAPTDRTDHLAVMEPFLRQAVEHVAGRLVLLSASSLDRGGPLMGQVHAWLAEHAPCWSALRPSWFMQNIIAERLPGILEHSRITSATGDGKIAFIDAADIAAVAVELLARPELPSREHLLTGPQAISYGDVAALITEITGRTVLHERLTTAELAQFYRSIGVADEYAPVLASMDEAISNGSEDRVTDEVFRITGRRPRSYREFIAENRATFVQTAPTPT